MAVGDVMAVFGDVMAVLWVFGEIMAGPGCSARLWRAGYALKNALPHPWEGPSAG